MNLIRKTLSFLLILLLTLSTVYVSPAFAGGYFNFMYDFDTTGTSILKNDNTTGSFPYNYLTGEWIYCDGGHNNQSINNSNRPAQYKENSISFTGGIGGKKNLDSSLLLATDNLTYSSSMGQAYTPSFAWSTVNYDFSDNFTADFDFYYTGNGQRYQIKFGYLDSNEAETQKDINITADGTVNFFGTKLTDTIFQNEWLNIAVSTSMSQKTAVLYINGEEKASVDLGAVFSGLKRIKFESRYSNTNGTVLNGSLAIDNLRLYTEGYAGILTASASDTDKALVTDTARSILVLDGSTVADANTAISANGNSIRFYRSGKRLSDTEVISDGDYAMVSNNLNSVKYHIDAREYIPKEEVSKTFWSISNTQRCEISEVDDGVVNPLGNVAYKVSGKSGETSAYCFTQAMLHDIEKSENPSAYELSFLFKPGANIDKMSIAMQSSTPMSNDIDISTLNQDKWNKIQVIYYTGAQTADLYINDVFSDSYSPSAVPTLFRLCLYKTSSAALENCYCYIDDIVLSEYTVDGWTLEKEKYLTNGAETENKFREGTFTAQISVKKNQAPVAPTLLVSQYSNGSLVKTQAVNSQLSEIMNFDITTEIDSTTDKIVTYLGDGITQPDTAYQLKIFTPYSTTEIEELQLLYPSYTTKALTLSFDDGEDADATLIEILNRYGIKGTFYLISSALENDISVYNGHEVGNHSKSHVEFADLSLADAQADIKDGKDALEDYAGTDVPGFAWPWNAPVEHSDYDAILAYMKSIGIKYARTNTSMSNSYSLPTDWMDLRPTCHVTYTAYLDAFLNEPDLGDLKYYYTYSHAWEFEEGRGGTWDFAEFESFAQKLANAKDIWFATTIDVHNYTEATEQLSQDGNTITNPTDMDLYVRINGINLCIGANSSYTYGS